VEKLSEYTIAFKGLKEGNHFFEYPINGRFFEHFENSLVDEAEITVGINLVKHSSFMELGLQLKGTVRLMCDRCLDFYDQPVYYKTGLFVKFGEGEHEADDEVIWLHPDDYQMNVAQTIYEYICLSVPLKHVHPVGGTGQTLCNPDMLRKIDEYSGHREETVDKRWDKLKNLLNNN